MLKPEKWEVQTLQNIERGYNDHIFYRVYI